MTHTLFRPGCLAAALLFGGPLTPGAHAEAAVVSAPDTSLIKPALIESLQSIITQPVVISSVKARNEDRKGLSQAEIDSLDAAWRKEEGSTGPQPFIAAALGSPVSTYLLREQVKSNGLLVALFITDNHGLNVGQSTITSDFWQGDEPKFLNTYPKGAGTVFIDEPEYIDEVGIWIAQVNLTIDDNGTPIGSCTFDVNLTELQRRRDLGL